MADKPARNDKSSSSSESDEKSEDSSDGDGKDGKKNARSKKESKKQAAKTKKTAAKRKRELKLGTKMTEKIAPILQQLTQCRERVTEQVKECMPPYQVLDMQAHVADMTKLSTSWSAIVKGTSTMAAETIDETSSIYKIAEAKTAVTALRTGLAGAEAIVAKRIEEAEGPPRKKLKKKKKKNKDDSE